MKYVGYYNGEIGPLEEMKIPMLDRAVYFGDGCYDATTFPPIQYQYLINI